MYFKCQNCGRKLKDPESRERGYGPECWGKITGIHVSEMGEDEQIDGQMSIFDLLDVPPERN